MGGWLKPWQNSTAGTEEPGFTPWGASTIASALRGAPKASSGSSALAGIKSCVWPGTALISRPWMPVPENHGAGLARHAQPGLPPAPEPAPAADTKIHRQLLELS